MLGVTWLEQLLLPLFVVEMLVLLDQVYVKMGDTKHMSCELKTILTTYPLRPVLQLYRMKILNVSSDEKY